jgi:hypothetical protein
VTRFDYGKAGGKQQFCLGLLKHWGFDSVSQCDWLLVGWVGFYLDVLVLRVVFG